VAARDAVCVLHALQHILAYLDSTFSHPHAALPSIRCDQIARALKPCSTCPPIVASWLQHACGCLYDCAPPLLSRSQMLPPGRELSIVETAVRCHGLRRALGHVRAQLLCLSEDALMHFRFQHSVLGSKLQQASLSHPQMTYSSVCSLALLDRVLDAPTVTYSLMCTGSVGRGALRVWIFDVAWDAEAVVPLALSPFVYSSALTRFAENERNEGDQSAQGCRSEIRTRVLTTSFALLRRRNQVELAFRTRNYRYSRPEFGRLFAYHVQAEARLQRANQPDTAKSHLRSAERWSLREEVLRRTVMRICCLERYAGSAMLATTSKMRILSESVLSQKHVTLRHLFVKAEEEQHKDEQDGHCIRTMATSAVQQLLTATARGPCLINTRSAALGEALAANFVRCLAMDNSCLCEEDASDATNAPCGRRVWTLQLHWLLVRVLRRQDAIVTRDEQGMRQIDEEQDESETMERRRVELSQFEIELLQLVQVATDGRTISSGPDITWMRSAALKAMVAVGTQGSLDWAGDLVRDVLSIVSDFDDMLSGQRRQCERHVSTESLQRLRSTDTCSSLTSCCCSPRRWWRDGRLALAQGRIIGVAAHANTVASIARHAEAASGQGVAVGASDSKIQLASHLHELESELDNTLAEKTSASLRIETRVRCEDVGELDASRVNELLVKGRLHEEHIRLRGVVQESCFKTKREATMTMVESGALPISLKQVTLFAVREEEAVNDVSEEALQLKLLLGRISTTSTLHLFKRLRSYLSHVQAAEQCRSHDEPVIEEMGASLRRQNVLRRKLLETQRALARSQDELAWLERRRLQLGRAIGKLVVPDV